MCLLAFSVVGEGFTMIIWSFHFSFFESPLGSSQARFCVPLRLSGATRVPLVLASSFLGPYFGCARVPQSCLKRESCWTLRALTKHVPACTERTSRPLPWSTETGPKARYVKNTPKLHLARSRRALLVPRGASGVFQRAHQEAEWAPETHPEEYSGPSVLEPTLRMVRSEAP